MKRFAYALLATIWLCSASKAQSLPEWSIWKNQKASLLLITKVDATAGTFRGTFVNNDGNFRCQGVAVPVAGKFTESDISFLANFAVCSNYDHGVEGKVERREDHKRLGSLVCRCRREFS